MIRNYFKTAWRSLWKYRATSFINIGGLAVGMAAAVLIFLWVQNELNFDKFQPDANRVYRIKNYLAIDKKTTWVWENSPYMLGEAAKTQVPEIEKITRINPMVYAPVYLNINGEQFPEEKSAYVDNEWLNVFQYEFVSGSAKAFTQNPFSLILSESKAKKYFGKSDPIGKLIKIDTVNYQVQAVVKDNPANSSFVFDVLMPLAARQSNPHEKENDLQWGNFNYMTFVKLKPGASIKKVTDKLKKITKEARKVDNLKIGLVSLAEIHFENDLQSSSLTHGDKKVVYIFGVLGIFLLLIACINYVNITTARASLRAKEVSIKKIVGAGRVMLFVQFVAESVLISLMALVLTLFLIWLSLPMFNSFTGKNFVLSLTDAYLWVVLSGTLLFAIVLNSIYPALLLSSFSPLNSFRGSSVLKVKDTSLRKGLVVVQFTFSIFLIIGVVTIYRQLQFIRTQNPGYNRSQVMTFSAPFKVLFKIKDEKQRASQTQAIKHALQQESVVEQVSLLGARSIQDNRSLSSGGADWDGREKEFDPAIAYFRVDPDYSKIVKLQFKEGRWFMPGSKADEKNFVLNETAAKEFGLHKPYVGQRFVAQGDTGQVIGVVKDFYYRTMHDKIGPAVFQNNGDYSFSYLVKVAPGKQQEAVKRIEKLWKSYFPTEPFEYTFLDDEFDKLYRDDTKASGLISTFAIIAILISCLGLFGLAAFTAEQRGKEIGIRKVLGATVSGIVSLLTKDFVVLVVIALVIASPLAWWLMSKWLQNFAYRINIQWWMFLLAGIIAIIIAFVSVGYQAVRAAIANPVKRLRSE